MVTAEEETLGGALLRRRTERGQSQTAAAAEVGTTQARWSSWEGGAMPDLTPEMVEALCRYLGVDFTGFATTFLTQYLRRHQRRP